MVQKNKREKSIHKLVTCIHDFDNIWISLTVTLTKSNPNLRNRKAEKWYVSRYPLQVTLHLATF